MHVINSFYYWQWWWKKINVIFDFDKYANIWSYLNPSQNIWTARSVFRQTVKNFTQVINIGVNEKKGFREDRVKTKTIKRFSIF